MGRFSLFTIFILLFMACEQQPEVTELEYDNTWVGRNLAAQESEGKKLWRVNCALCHTSSNNYPDRLYATREDIVSALANVASMKNLTHISEENIDDIYNYLNNEAITTIRENKVDTDVKRSHVLGTHKYIVSKMLAIYGEGSKDIVEEILKYPGSFGGTCSSLYEDCAGDETENAGTAMNVSSNTLRRGTIIKVCRQLHDNSTYLDEALSYLEIDPSVELTNGMLRTAIDGMVNDSTSVRDDLMKELKTIYNKAIAKGKTKKEAWNFVIYSLCSSLAFEKV